MTRAPIVKLTIITLIVVLLDFRANCYPTVQIRQHFPVSKGVLIQFAKALKKDQFIQDAINSDDGSAVAVLVYRKVGAGSDYGGVYVARIDKEKDQILSAIVFLPATEFRMTEGNPFVEDISKLNNRGDRILLKVGTQTQPVAPYYVLYDWQIREIPSGRVIQSHLERNSTLETLESQPANK